MRNLRTTIALLAMPTLFYAQTLTYSGQTTATSIEALSANSQNSKKKDETPEQARKLVMAQLNNFRGFSVSVDELKKGDNELDEPSMSEKKNNYADYLQKMETVLTRNLKTIETDAIKDAQQIAEKSKILSALNILKSANCLVEKKDGQFARQKDLEGNEIVVWNDEITAPVAVRYAWADNPKATIYNAASFPAVPFRTDDWPGVTINNK